MEQNVDVRINASAGDLQSETTRAAGAVRNFAGQIKQAARDAVSASRNISQGMGQSAASVTQSGDRAGDAATRMGTRIKTALRGAVGIAREFGLGFREGMQQAVREADQAADKVTADMKRMNSAGRGGGRGRMGIGGAIAGLGLGAAAVGAAAGIVGTIAEYEKLGASLKTFTGSQAAANAQLQELAKLGASTPYQLAELTQGFTTLKSRGLDSSIPALTAYGNMASAMGKDFQQMIEAVADAGTGEFERLKEFGVVAKKNGDQVAMTFGGVTTNVANNATAIQGYLQNLANTNFGGAMAEQSATLAGAWSNTVDVAAGFAAAVGVGGLSGALQGVLRDINMAGAGAQGFGLIIGQGLGAAITGAWNVLKQFNATLAPSFAQLRTLIPVVQPLAQAFISLGRSLISALGPVIKAAIDAIIPAMRAIAPALTPVVKAVDDLLKQFMATFGPSIISLIRSAVDVIKTIIVSISDVVTRVVNAVTALLRGDFVGAWQGLKGAIGAACDGLVNVVRSILGGLGDLLKTIGKQIIDGLVNGFNERKQAAIDAARNLATQISNGFKGVLRIQSPSREFADHGKNIAQGVAIGIIGGAQTAVAAAGRLADYINASFTDAMRSLVGELSSVMESLMTDEEKAFDAYLRRLDTLKAAHDNGLLSAEAYADALARLESQRSAEIRSQIPALLNIKEATPEDFPIPDLPEIQLPATIELPDQEITTFADRWRQAMSPLRQGFSSLIENMVTGAQSWQDIMLNVGRNILSNLSQMFVDLAWQWIQNEVLRTGATAVQTEARVGIEAAGAAQSTAVSATSSISKIAHNAYTAAAGAYSAIAAIPIVGPVLAPVAAAAALAGVFALGKSIFSARGGFGKVPYDGAVTELHKDEMVLPAYIASPLRTALASGGASMPSVGMALAGGAASGQRFAADQEKRAQEMAQYIAAQGGAGGKNITIKSYGTRDVRRLLESGSPFVKKGLERLARDGVK